MKRIITGLVLISVGLFVIIKSGAWLFLFLLLAGILSFYELYKIGDQTRQRKGLLLMNTLFYSGILYGFFVDGFSKVGHGVFIGMILLFYLVAISEFYLKKLLFLNQLLLSNIRNFVYVTGGFSSLLLIRLMPNGLMLVFLLLVAIWASDIFALYGGRAFGKHSLSSVSPNKTIEGTCIGAVSSMVIIGIACYFFQLSFGYIIIAGLVALWGQLGDLYESLIKRTYNVKDSSNILPGHGGILDRSDSSLFVFSMVYVLIYLLG